MTLRPRDRARRARRALGLVAQEIRAVWTGSRAFGVHDALVARARFHLDLPSLATRDELAPLATRDELAPLATREELASVRADLTPDERRRAIDALHARVMPVTAWVREVDLPPVAPSVTVILPTYNRRTQLVRAIGSVLAQEYPEWQLVIVDDGSSDGTNALADRYAANPRILWLETDHKGVSRARNRGLEAATGDVICYLDDDNTMDRLWLKAVAWAFWHNPEVEVLYGGRVMDEPRAGDSLLPLLQLEPWDRKQILRDNYVDMGTIAHRRGLPEARFDESLDAWVDYEMFLRLTEHRTPLALPVIASFYTSHSPDRISLSQAPAVAEPIVRARWMAPRVLAYNSLFPLVTETYIEDEMRALADAGMPLAWCTANPMPSPMTVEGAHFLDVDQAVAAFDPDLLFLYWTDFALAELHRLERIGRPFALRVHSFDFRPEAIKEVQAHRLCVGVWTYPHHAGFVGAHPLASLVTRPDDLPAPAAHRPLVLSASAGLPKKDWPTLIAAFAELADGGAECRIVIGRTQGFEYEGEHVRAMVADTGADIMVMIDMPHDDVLALLARTAVVVYTTNAETFGQPRSIVEGLCAATAVVLPDREEARMAGPRARLYRNAADVVSHCRQVLAGDDEIRQEWAANRQWGLERYASPALAEQFADEVRSAVESHGRAD